MKPPPLARFFHKFPHVNVTFHRVNSTFDLNNQVYLESLGILASVPALILILILFLLLLYLLTRCCDRNAKRDRSFVCLKVLLMILGLTCCASIGLGLYGNDDFHNGIEILVQNLGRIRSRFLFIVTRTTDSATTIETSIFPLMSKLGVVFERPLSNESAHIELLSQMTYMEGNISTTRDNAETLREIFTDAIYSIPPVQIAEAIRWPSTLTLLICFIIFCVILFYAIVRHSRCCFITFSVVGLLAVIINWSLVSIYLVGAVALSDACVNPNRPAMAHVKIPAQMASYYLNCMEDYSFIDISGGIRSVEGAQHTLRVINSIAGNYYNINDVESLVDSLFKELYQVEEYLKEIRTSSKCQEIKGYWMKGVESVCGISLFGLCLLLVSSIFSSLLFTLLVGFDSHTWIYIQKRSDRKHHQREECVQFLPYGGNMSGNRRSGGAGLHSHLLLVPATQYSNGSEAPMGHPHVGSLDGKYQTLSKHCKTLEANDFY